MQRGRLSHACLVLALHAKVVSSGTEKYTVLIGVMQMKCFFFCGPVHTVVSFIHELLSSIS
jgi:hypothetical protein